MKNTLLVERGVITFIDFSVSMCHGKYVEVSTELAGVNAVPSTTLLTELKHRSLD